MEKMAMGTLGEEYRDGIAKYITLCVTEECNLRCKYCYMTGKNSFNRMSFETAKAAVDYFLSCEFEENAVVWDFIGGEPTLEIDLIDAISDYIKIRLYELKHKWLFNFRFSICSNGILYSTEKVQNYIRKNITNLSFTITIDGTKEKHDLNRVFPDGRGSYDIVIKNIPLWQKQFPGNYTKVTFASEDLKYLKESIIHLWSLGLKIIPANVVFEDVWADGDEIVFEEQLKELADYIICNKMWDDYSVRFFDPTVGLPMSKTSKQNNFCGSGRMVAVDCNGNFYPCIRFLDFCADSKNVPLLTCGNIASGLDPSALAPFKHLTIDLVNDEECKNCPVASGCFACAGNNYNYANPHTIYTRTKFHCKMHKAQARANEYFWSKLTETLRFPTPRELRKATICKANNFNLDGIQYLYVLLSDQEVPYCCYEATSSCVAMDSKMLKQALAFARSENRIPVIIGNPSHLLDWEWNTFFVNITADVTNQYIMEHPLQEIIPIITKDNYQDIDFNGKTCILSISSKEMEILREIVVHCKQHFVKINVVFQDVQSWTTEEIIRFQQERNELSNYLVDEKKVIIDILNTRPTTVGLCHAGDNCITVAPNGNLYVCPAFYYGDPSQTLGSIYKGMISYDKNIFNGKKQIVCDSCDAKYCKRCSWLNRKYGKAENVCAKEQCDIFCL